MVSDANNVMVDHQSLRMDAMDLYDFVWVSCGGLASVFPLMTVGLFGLKALGAIFGLILLGATFRYLFIFTNLRIIVKSKLKVSLKPTLYSVGLGWFQGNTQNNKLI